jgi:hypothetical protein
VPTIHYAANSAWQLLGVLAFNLMRGFQLATTARRRGATCTRRSGVRFETSPSSVTCVCTAPA